MNLASSAWVELAVLGYCTLEAYDVMWAWSSSPLIRWGWAAFLIWIAPIVFYIVDVQRRGMPKESTLTLLAAAVLFTLVGSLGDLNASRYLGLALAVSGFLPWTWAMVIWIPSALSWMPAFGWFFRSLPVTAVHLLQVSIALVGTTAMLAWGIKRRRS